MLSFSRAVALALAAFVVGASRLRPRPWTAYADLGRGTCKTVKGKKPRSEIVALSDLWILLGHGATECRFRCSQKPACRAYVYRDYSIHHRQCRHILEGPLRLCRPKIPEYNGHCMVKSQYSLAAENGSAESLGAQVHENCVALCGHIRRQSLEIEAVLRHQIRSICDGAPTATQLTESFRALLLDFRRQAMELREYFETHSLQEVQQDCRATCRLLCPKLPTTEDMVGAFRIELSAKRRRALELKEHYESQGLRHSATEMLQKARMYARVAMNATALLDDINGTASEVAREESNLSDGNTKSSCWALQPGLLGLLSAALMAASA